MIGYVGFPRDPQPLTSAGRIDRHRLKADQIIEEDRASGGWHSVWPVWPRRHEDATAICVFFTG
jgi:hypothetical protein